MRVLSRRPRAADDRQAGSGTAIGVAVIFPALMLVIVSLQALADASTSEQALQTAANRAARVASLCCNMIEDRNDGAAKAASDALKQLGTGVGIQKVDCVNEDLGDPDYAWIDFSEPSGRSIAAGAPDMLLGSGGNTEVPRGGQVTVVVRCELAASNLGRFVVGSSEVVRTGIGTASIDPYRDRAR